MCGISGIINITPRPVEKALLEEMTELLSSRGPDDTGYWYDERVGFGHKRLSIIDLSDAGHQPMVDAESGCVVVYNGEIYNHKELRNILEGQGYVFKSRTDTEVLLKAYLHWGKGCLEKFNGMFAFAIWDTRNKKLFAARDRLGIKPFYYFNNGSTFVFASRPKSVMAYPECSGKIDVSALGLYLDVGFVPWPWSMIDGVKKLEAGHWLELDASGRQVINQYWSLADQWRREKLNISEQNAQEMLAELLSDSVKLRMEADVPVGAFLSGGVDSSAVVAMMGDHADMSLVKTFCVNFNDENNCDAEYARSLSDYLGCDHREYNFSPERLISLVDKLPEIYDEPIADISLLPILALSEFSKKEVTVCLSGDGGDELFGGYPNYSRLGWFDRLIRMPGMLKVLAVRFLRMKNGHNSHLAAEAMGYENTVQIAAFMRTMRKDLGSRPVRDGLNAEIDFYKLAEEMNNQGKFETYLDGATCLDALYFLQDDNLQKVDVASMAYALEVRVPLLDHRIVEFAGRLPAKYKISRGNMKNILKKAVESKVPANFFDRPKAGFAPPIDRWIKDELKDWILAELSKEKLDKLGVLDYKAVSRILDLHMSGERIYSSYIWLLVTLVRWQEYYKVGL